MTKQTEAQPLTETQADALNTLCKMLHSGEEVEGDDGLAMLVPMDLWNEAQDAIELLIGEDDGTEAATLAAQVERATQPQPVQQEPVTDAQIMACVGRNFVGASESRPLGQQWEQVCNLVRHVIRERYTNRAPQPAPQPLSDQEIADAAPVNETLAHGFKLGVRWAEAAHGITKGTT